MKLKGKILIISPIILLIILITELVLSTNIYSILPSPLIYEGKKITKIEDWNYKKEDIKKMLINEQLGSIPELPKFTAKVIKTEEYRKSIKQIINIEINNNGSQNLNFEAISYIIKNKENLPTIICIETNECNKNDLIETSIENDYNFITYETEKLSPEIVENPEEINHLKRIYKDYTWGDLAVRAWLGLIVTEYIKSIKGIDKNKLIVTGHSRNGKVALILGFINSEFIITNPVNSGITGANVVKFYGYKSNDLAYLTSPNRYHYWYTKNFSKRYSRNEKKMLFDSHFQLALVSPRNLLIQISEDLWDNPIGGQIAYEGALPVYKLMKAEDNLSISFTENGHKHSSVEIKDLINYANYKFEKKERLNEYKKLKFSRIDKIKTLLYIRFKMSRYKIVKTVKSIIY